MTGALEIGGETSNALIPFNVNSQSTRQRFWDGQDQTWRDDISILHGNHLLQFGVLYQRNFDYHERNDNGGGILNQPVNISTSGSGINYNGYEPAICPTATSVGRLPSTSISTYKLSILKCWELSPSRRISIPAAARI